MSLTLPLSTQKILDAYLPPQHVPSTSTSTSPSSRPFHLTLTYATSLDASISLSPGTQTLLSGAESKAMTHYLRARHDAILVGVGTAEADDPGLNCRFSFGMGGGGREGVEEVKQPVPVILDPNARWRVDGGRRVIRLAREGMGRGVLWVVGRSVDSQDLRKGVVEAYDGGAGGEVIVIPGLARTTTGPHQTKGISWALLIAALQERGLDSLMVEGGAMVLEDLLGSEVNRDLVSSVVVTFAPVWLGRGGVTVSPGREEKGIGMEVARLRDVRWMTEGMGRDVVLLGRFGG